VLLLNFWLDVSGGGAVAELGRLATDPRTVRRTRVVAASAYARAVGNLVQSPPVVNVQQGISLTASDLLRLVPAGPPTTTTGRGPALPDLAPPVLLPNGDHQEGVPRAVPDVRSDEPEVVPVSVDVPDVMVGPEPEFGTKAHASWVERRDRYQVPPAEPSAMKCPDCGAEWEAGHEQACPVPKEGA
jgi:hypothetical protein